MSIVGLGFADGGTDSNLTKLRIVKKQTLKNLWVASCTAVMLTAASSAQAVSLSFLNITHNGGSDVASQLSVDVTDDGSGGVNFKFFNNVGTASSITDIYFADGTLLGIASITDSGAGVDFSQGASPGDLPGGNSASPPFVTTVGFSTDSNPPAAPNGVNASTEWVTINFDLINGKTFADTVAALNDGSLRVGLRIQALPRDESDGYVNHRVPDGGTTLLLLGSALTGLALLRRRLGMKA